MGIQEFIEEVKIKGNIFSGSTDIDLSDIDAILHRLSMCSKDKEVLIFCDTSFTEHLKRVFNSDLGSGEHGVFKNDSHIATGFISELGFSTNGYTMYLIEKPNMFGKALWVHTGEDASPENSLLIIEDI